MGGITNYSTDVQAVIEDYVQQMGADKEQEIEAQMIFDPLRDHYQLVYAGWQNRRRVYGCVVHMDVKKDKIWIQHDGTEVGMANLLVERGVPKDKIVLAFQSPFKRQFGDFAVA